MRTEFFILLLTIGSVLSTRIKSNKQQGLSEIENRIIGGVAAADGAAPYQVSIQNLNGGHSCGGAIVDERWVLTAAHCIFNNIIYGREEFMRVVTGTNKYKEPGAIYYVEKLYVHCNYDDPDYMNDIGLIRLNSSIVFNEKTSKISLPDKPLKAGDELVLTGWGSTELYGETPEELQTVTLNFVPHKQCLEDMDGHEGVGVSHICTFTRYGEGACHGDSGGPLTHGNMLYGLVNWGNPCAIGSPDMHANVWYFLDWIRQHLSECNGWSTNV